MQLEHFLRRHRTAASTLSTLVLGAGLGAVAVQHAANPAAPPSVHAALEQGISAGGFSGVVHRVTPAVVNISTSKTVKVSQRGMGDMDQLPPGLREFFGNNFGQGFGGRQAPQRPRSEHALGSGVIVDPQGYVLTNNHVVEDATEVTVSLADRREFKAKVVGTDPKTDIAVLKIEGKNFPTVPVGDSSHVQVGDLAFAVGNPFGIGQTVTMGIVSATGRSGLNIEQYEDFIQTDAAINPGNSGGALINSRGELIGINTAILSGRTGGNQGIGFAVPIGMASDVMGQLVKTGKVTRGYVGVGIQPLTPAIARSFKLADNTDGVVVTEVQPNSPGSRAGLQAGDVITGVNDKSVIDANQFRLQVSRFAPGTAVTMKVIRDGQTRTVPVTLASYPDDKTASNREPGAESSRNSALEGVDVEAVNAQTARQLGLPARTEGVVVTDVEEGSAAARAGLREGDLIQQVNRKPVTTVREFESAVRTAGKDVVSLLIRRGENQAFLAIEPRG